MSTTRRLLLLAHVPILLGWIILATLAYGDLPERIPTHFDASGTPDGFMDRSVASWFLLPLVGTISALMIVFSTAYTSRNPHLWNVPNKQKFMALSDDDRRPLVEMMHVFLTTVSLSTIVFLSVLHYDMWRVARGSTPGLSPLSISALVLLFLVGFGGAVMVMLRFSRRVNELEPSGR